jgi:hypothetical protein
MGSAGRERAGERRRGLGLGKEGEGADVVEVLAVVAAMLWTASARHSKSNGSFFIIIFALVDGCSIASFEGLEEAKKRPSWMVQLH